MICCDSFLPCKTATWHGAFPGAKRRRREEAMPDSAHLLICLIFPYSAPGFGFLCLTSSVITVRVKVCCEAALIEKI